MSIIRIKAVKEITGHKSHASIYQQIKELTFTKPVLIGRRSVGWPDYEVKAIVNARIQGKNENELRLLVQKLHSDRQQTWQV